MRLLQTYSGHPEGESMNVGFDGGIKLEFHGAKLSSNGGLLAYRDLDHAMDCLIQCQRLLLINVQAVISTMLCPLFCDNRYAAALLVMKMSTTPSNYPLILSCGLSPGKKTPVNKLPAPTRWDVLKQISDAHANASSRTR